MYDHKMCLQCMHRRSEAEVDRICELIDSGRESNTPGLLEQWLREGKLTKETAIDEAQNLFPAGVDTVSSVTTIRKAIKPGSGWSPVMVCCRLVIRRVFQIQSFNIIQTRMNKSHKQIHNNVCDTGGNNLAT